MPSVAPILRGLAVTILAVAWSVDGAASATPTEATADPYRWPGARPLPRRSSSLGYPFRGALRDGVRVVDGPYVDLVDEYADEGHFYGTWELVQLVERAAWRVHRRAPGARLGVGELSRRGGGPLTGHGSHQAGRDVDLSFYIVDGGGRPFEPHAFARFRGDGTARPPNEGLRFDDIRNWELVAKLVADGDARVQFIFVAHEIKRRLLRIGRARRAPPAVLARAEQVMVQPRRAQPHDDHFHVRIYCSPGDRPRCQDRGPFHPWYPGTPPPLAAMAP